MSVEPNMPLVAIGCGGTGGHLFPGLAVAEVLQQAGCDIALLVSGKEVDQHGVKSASEMQVITLPAVALQGKALGRFLLGFCRSYRICRRLFRQRVPRAILGMGGFTSAPPILAGNALGAKTFLHESNSIPGRANRWLSPWVDEVFTGYGMAARRLSNQAVTVTGTPVRSSFRLTDAGSCRIAMGLAPDKPVLLVVGGSQGAAAINELVCRALPLLASQAPTLQFLHLTGPNDAGKIQAAYSGQKRRAVVRPFLTEMELALGAANLAISRAGASSLAEFAAMQLPAVLIPYPHAADNHQLYNARALVESGAARQLDQALATPESLAADVLDILSNETGRVAMQTALGKWHRPHAAQDIADRMLMRMGIPKTERGAHTELTPDFRLPPRPRTPPGGKRVTSVALLTKRNA